MSASSRPKQTVDEGPDQPPTGPRVSGRTPDIRPPFKTILFPIDRPDNLIIVDIFFYIYFFIHFTHFPFPSSFHVISIHSGRHTGHPMDRKQISKLINFMFLVNAFHKLLLSSIHVTSISGCKRNKQKNHLISVVSVAKFTCPHTGRAKQ